MEKYISSKKQEADSLTVDWLCVKVDAAPSPQEELELRQVPPTNPRQKNLVRYATLKYTQYMS